MIKLTNGDFEQDHAWEDFKWETFSNIINDKYFKISKCDALSSPIKKFILERDENLNIILKTSCEAPIDSKLMSHPPGTVWEDRCTIEFSSVTGFSVSASGVVRRSWKESIDHAGSIYSQEIASINEIECRIKPLSQEKYLIEWLANVDDKFYIWPDHIDDEVETQSRRALCVNKSPFLLVSKKKSISGSRSCINISVNGYEIYLGFCKNVTLNDGMKPGFILYKDNAGEVFHELL